MPPTATSRKRQLPQQKSVNCHNGAKYGLECDAVVHLRDGRYGLIEVKIGGDALVEKGCASLRRLRDALDTEKMREPSFMMVLTAVGDFAYRRPDDVIVCPIGALRP